MVGSRSAFCIAWCYIYVLRTWLFFYSPPNVIKGKSCNGKRNLAYNYIEQLSLCAYTFFIFITIFSTGIYQFFRLYWDSEFLSTTPRVTSFLLELLLDIITCLEVIFSRTLKATLDLVKNSDKIGSKISHVIVKSIPHLELRKETFSNIVKIRERKFSQNNFLKGGGRMEEKEKIKIRKKWEKDDKMSF